MSSLTTSMISSEKLKFTVSIRILEKKLLNLCEVSEMILKVLRQILENLDR